MTTHKLTEIINLPTKKETYEESIHRHLREASEDLKSASPEVVIVFSLDTAGLSYHTLTDNSTLEVLGALEVLKNYFLLDHLGD